MAKSITLSTQQLTYLEAKALEETLHQQLQERMEGVTYETDEEFEVYINQEEAIRTELKLFQIEQNRRLAEDALIAWGFRVAHGTKMSKEHSDIIDFLERKINVHYTVRAKMIEIVMRLDASTIR